MVESFIRMEDILSLNSAVPLPLVGFIINLLICIILSSVVAWSYARFGRSLTNRMRFAQTLPILALTTLLVISVVKSSVAISLGLVGALSIVRFRTAIKEPEELVYLFISIAIGLGLGGDQRWATTIAIVVILGVIIARSLLTKRVVTNNLFISISTNGDVPFEAIDEVVQAQTVSAELRRFDAGGNEKQAVYFVTLQDKNRAGALIDQIRSALPESVCSFVDQDIRLS